MRVDELKKSYKKFGPLYPVLVDSVGKTIDGYHRRRVDPNWPSIKVNAKDDIQREIIALVANVNRREISGSEISKRLGKLAKLTGWAPRKIAQEIGREYEWVLKYLPQRYKDKTQAKKRKGTRNEQFDEPSQSNSSENPQTELFVLNVWENGEQRPNYGDKNFHGNTPPNLIKQCLLKYASKNDVVLDPMAGSGTAIDLCNELEYKIRAFDIKPLRDDIEFGDAEKLNLKNTSIDFIFAHFPYWKKVVYSDDPNDLSRLPFDKFIDKSEKIIKEMHRILKSNRFFVILIGDERHNGKLKDLTSHLSLIGSKYFVLFDKIIYLNKNQPKRSQGRIEQTLMRWRAKKAGSHLIAADTLLIFRKEA